jgi:hypothetical protein
MKLLKSEVFYMYVFIYVFFFFFCDHIVCISFIPSFKSSIIIRSNKIYEGKSTKKHRRNVDTKNRIPKIPTERMMFSGPQGTIDRQGTIYNFPYNVKSSDDERYFIKFYKVRTTTLRFKILLPIPCILY